MELLFQAFLLGIVEGITEFLPISSTGHLILVVDMLGFAAPPGRVFEVVIQFGAILAVCTVFRQRVRDVVCTLHRSRSTQRFVFHIALAFLPAAIIGLLAHDFIKNVLFSPMVVAVMLVVGGIAILLIEKWRPAAIINDVDGLTPRHALWIGVAQAIAMIPGTSRSGATMMGALLLGIDRRTAAEFSFLLAIPTMAAASAYDLYKNWHLLSLEDGQLIAAGFLSAFLAALLSVRWLLSFLTRHGFGIFAWYRIALGTVMLMLLNAN